MLRSQGLLVHAHKYEVCMNSKVVYLNVFEVFAFKKVEKYHYVREVYLGAEVLDSGCLSHREMSISVYKSCL